MADVQPNNTETAQHQVLRQDGARPPQVDPAAISAKGAFQNVTRKASIPAEKREQSEQIPDDQAAAEKAKAALDKPEPMLVGPEAILPIFAEANAFRAACVGNVDVNGAGTTAFADFFSAYYKSRRVQSLYLASEIGCDGGPISGIKYYVSGIPDQTKPLPNVTIRIRHTTNVAYPSSGACFDNAGWTDVYTSASLLISATGWYEIPFTTPFIYDGVSNLEVDFSFGQLAAYGSDTGRIYSYTASATRSLRARSDTVPSPLTWTCTTTTPSFTVSAITSMPRIQFIFPAPSTGACCVGTTCTGTMEEAACLGSGGAWIGGADCATFYCPPVNDNCSAVTPVALTSGVPVTFTGNNLGATNDCAGFSGGQVWEAFTLPSTMDVTLDYCGTTPAFGNAWLNLATTCPCSTNTAAGTYDTTTCTDGNVTIRWKGLAAGTYYYPVLLDPNAAGPYTINVVGVQAYCAAAATSTADETIDNFTFASINNTTTGCDTYDDFTAISTDAIRGGTYPFSLTIGDCEGTSCYQKKVGIWVDWNQDWAFDPTTELAYASAQLPNTPCPTTTITGSITVPVDAALGATRMRVLVNETTSAIAPCGTFSWGAVEDYTIIVLAADAHGACCLGMTCQDGNTTQAQCDALGGIYMGDGSTCAVNVCAGACCIIATGACVETANAADCTALAGNFYGGGTTCAATVCPTPGDDCTMPAQATVAPGTGILTINDHNCGRGNAYSNTCLGSYDGGEDYILQLNVTADMNVKITLNPQGTTWTGIALDDSCPFDATTCLAKSTNSGSSAHGIPCTPLAAGTYFIMVDTYPSPNCVPAFTITIEESCTLPITVGEDCATAYTIPALPFVADFNNDTYTAHGPAAECDGYGATVMQNDAWLKYTTTADCYLQLSATTTYSASSVMNIWIGPDCDNLQLALCVWQAPFEVTGTLAAGTTVWFQVGDDGTYETGGTVNFNLNCSSGSGACCFPSGACQVMPVLDCVNAAGAYEGDNTSCDPNPCPQPQPGDNCALPFGPIVLPAGLPYTDAAQTTCGHDNDYAATCLGSYDGGEDVIYMLTVTEAFCSKITVTGNGASNNWIGVAVDSACPLGETACMAAAASSSGTVATIDGLVLPVGTYYIMIDTYPAPDCLASYTLEITQSTACPVGACCDGNYGGLFCYVTFEASCVAAGGGFVGVGTTCAGQDCLGYGEDDTCSIYDGLDLDCNNNGTPDSCDIASGASLDVDQNGVPDECDQDCNANNVPDACELPGGCAVGLCGATYPELCGTQADCQGNGVPDGCELGAKKSRLTYAIDDGVSENSVGLTSGGTVAWLNRFVAVDGATKITAVSIAYGNVPDGTPLTIYVWADPDNDGNPDDAVVVSSLETVTANGNQDPAVFNVVDIPDAVVGSAGDFFFVGAIITHAASEYPAAIDETAPAGLSYLAGNGTDPNSLGTWAIAVGTLEDLSGGDLSGNWLVRAEGGFGGADCNGNGIPDECDVAPICQGAGCSLDCDQNLVPDECQVDCNANGIPDACDIAAGTPDCNANGIPDSCDIATGAADCNANGIPDSCEIAGHDCNNNGILDVCDIAAGTSQDCQIDGIPDECQLTAKRAVILSEGFDDITTLTAAGWFTQNNSNPVGTTTWFQGNDTVFPSHSGAVTSYIGANYNSTGDTGDISTWLLTPALALENGCTLDFYTRGPACTTCYADRMQVRLAVTDTTNVGVGPADVGDFGTLLLDVNPTYVANGYPQSWDAGHFTVTITGLSGPITGRLAFRYFVEDGGYSGAHSNFIGIDTVTISGPSGPPANDCNTNGIPDECDISILYGGFCNPATSPSCATDVNGNGTPDECEPMCGDLNGDQTVSNTDWLLFWDAYRACTGDPRYLPEADFDADGCITLVDYSRWLACYKMFNGGKEFSMPKPGKSGKLTRDPVALPSVEVR